MHVTTTFISVVKQYTLNSSKHSNEIAAEAVEHKINMHQMTKRR